MPVLASPCPGSPSADMHVLDAPELAGQPADPSSFRAAVSTVDPELPMLPRGPSRSRLTVQLRHAVATGRCRGRRRPCSARWTPPAAHDRATAPCIPATSAAVRPRAEPPPPARRVQRSTWGTELLSGRRRPPHPALCRDRARRAGCLRSLLQRVGGGRGQHGLSPRGRHRPVRRGASVRRPRRAVPVERPAHHSPLWLTLLCGIGGVLIGYYVSGALGVKETAGIDWIRWIISIILAAVLVVAASTLSRAGAGRAVDRDATGRGAGQSRSRCPPTTTFSGVVARPSAPRRSPRS